MAVRASEDVSSEDTFQRLCPMDPRPTLRLMNRTVGASGLEDHRFISDKAEYGPTVDTVTRPAISLMLRNP